MFPERQRVTCRSLFNPLPLQRGQETWLPPLCPTLKLGPGHVVSLVQGPAAAWAPYFVCSESRLSGLHTRAVAALPGPGPAVLWTSPSCAHAQWKAGKTSKPLGPCVVCAHLLVPAPHPGVAQVAGVDALPAVAVLGLGAPFPLGS